MDSDDEITGFIEVGGEDEQKTSRNTLFHANLEQRVGMILSAVIILLCLLVILYLVLKIRRKNRSRTSAMGERLAGGGMFDRNIEMVAEFPYSQLSSAEN